MKNKVFAGVVLAILLVSMFTLALNIQPARSTYSVLVRVRDEKNNPVEGASVVLDGTVMGQTNIEGELSVYNVTEGTHIILVIKWGYQDEEVEVNVTSNMVVPVTLKSPPSLKIVEGPGVSQITTDSALVSWETDEKSDSVVWYDKVAVKYSFEEKELALVKNHRIRLTSLEPSTTYQFLVQSTDGSGNTIVSKDNTFKTSALPDDEPPVIYLKDPGACNGTVVISANASDNIGVEKVEFYIENDHVFTDYSPPYMFRWDTTKYANRSGSARADAKTSLEDIYDEVYMNISAMAYDHSRLISYDMLTVPVYLPRLDLWPPSVEIVRPSPGDSLSGRITVEAQASDNVGVDRVEFFVDDEYRSCDEISPYIFDWDTRTVLDGWHTVGAVAFDTSGLNSYHEIHVLTSNPVLQPVVVVTRGGTIWYGSTGFQVELIVYNIGGVVANNIEIIDSVKGFQILPYYLREVDGLPRRFDTLPRYYSARGAIYSDPPTSEIHFDAFDLDPGESTRIHYRIIPILTGPPPEDAPRLDFLTFYLIGHRHTDLSYSAPNGEHYAEVLHIGEFTANMRTRSLDTEEDNWHLYRAVEEVLANADYLIVTNPRRLFHLYVEDDVNALLASMAELAWLKDGVLGYLMPPRRPVVSPDFRSIRDAIEPGGSWASQLHPVFSEPLGGYLLFVGEHEIVPAVDAGGYAREYSDGTRVDIVQLTDNYYADINDDDAPELIVGRIIGDSAAHLREPIQASIDATLGLPRVEFDRANALLVSGTGSCVGDFIRNINEIEDIIDPEFNVEKIHWSDFPNTLDMYIAFRNAAPSKDVICFSDHGNIDSWSPALTTGMPLNFGDKNPFAFALACSTGDYESGDDYNIAEFFFDSGAAVYIGSTELSPISLNCLAGKKFFRNWDASESIGQSFTMMEHAFARWWGDWLEFWVAEYNLYGDPKYGRMFDPGVLDQVQGIMAGGYGIYDDVFHWQEFKPLHTSLSQIDIWIIRAGDPGNLRVMIKNSLENILWETTIPRESVRTTSGWTNIPVSPSVPLISGNSYYLYVWSDADSPSPTDRYVWYGKADSDYDRGISSGSPGWDFAFRTWSALDATSSASVARGALEALSSLEVVIPYYNVTTIDGFDYVEIPGGMLLLEEGKPQVPYYTVSVDYPERYEINDVVLTDRSGLVTATGLNLSTVTMEQASSASNTYTSSSSVEGGGWYPEEAYSWRTFEKPDGSITLVVIMYPFYYDPVTTDVNFYRNYSFAIDYTISNVTITSLTTNKNAYVQGDTVTVDINLDNLGVAQDVIFAAWVKRYVSEEIIDGLLLHTLEDLPGPGSFSSVWDSSGFEPGYYCVEVTLKDTSGNLLDRKTEMFKLGISSGQITSLTATPEYFHIGDEVEINMTFNNIGTVNITGVAVTRITNSTGYLVEEFRHNITDLTPTESISFSDVWYTSEAEEGSYNVMGIVLYESKTTDPATATIHALTRAFDWWPMFRHDLNHTGYSTSTAPSTNNTIWTYTGLTVSSSPAVVDDKVYIGISNKLYCLNASTGAPIWSYATGSGVYSSPAVADGKVYVGSWDKRIYCLNASDGTHIWNYTTDGPVESSPAVAYDKVYVGSHDGKVYCLNASTGALIWNYTAGFSVVSSPAVADGKVYVGAIGGLYHNVYCLNASTGALIWNYTAGYSVFSSPAVADGKVYVGSYDNNVYCLNASTGALIWNYTTDGAVYSSPAVADGRVYVGSYDNRTYCLNASTGAHIWNYPTGDWVYSSPAVADGRVYVGSSDNNVYCLNASTGTEIWDYITGGRVLSSPAVADRKLYVGSEDGTVYAFETIYDVAITNITPSKTIVGQGCSVSIDVTVENQGTLTETFHVTVYYGNLTLTPEQWDTFWSMGDVNEDGYINQTDFDLIAAHFGTTDPQYDIDESGLVDMDDLMICGANMGKDIWTYFSIGDLIGKQTVYDLPAGNQSTLTFTWDTAGVLYNNWTITANATILPSETNTADNTRTCWVVVTISGDVNGDYIVDGSDLLDLNKAYGSTPNKPNWNPNCDLNDDYKVDSSDLFDLSKNYGKTV